MQNILTKIAGILAAPFLLIGSILNPTPAQAPLGAALPQAVGVFETSLAAPISSSATSLTLTANAIRGGGALSGYNCFTVDEGSAQAEVICGTVAGTAVTSLTRGISYSNGTSTVSGNQFAHRRGANVKITDFPIIQILKAQNNGEGTFENPIKYASTVSTTTLSTDGQNLASVAYANGLAFGGVPAASETASGFVELATGQEAASSTSTGGTGARLVLPASIATSTYNAGSSKNVVVTNASGIIDTGLLNATSTGGTSSANKIAQLNSSGVLDSTLIPFVFGDGSDGDVTISSPTTLTKDMYYDNLVINSPITTSGFRIFVKNTVSGNGSIIHNGSNGSGTTAGTTTGSGIFKTSAGGAGSPGVGGGGTGGAGTIGSAGGNGGAGDPTWGGTGAGGSVTKNFAPMIGSVSFPTTTGLNVASDGTISGFKGAGGGGGGGDVEGSGGGGGASGGFILLVAKKYTGTFTFSATGGNGGNATMSSGNGGGGGGGGAGGNVCVVYQTKTWTGSYTLTGGIGGTSIQGTSQNGPAGSSYEVNVMSLI